MPKPKTMDLIDACRSPIRRQIMQLASEAALTGKTLTAKGVAEALNRPLSGASYHVKALFEGGALRVVAKEQHRGALQTHYVPSKAFQATMTDTVALDQIAELIEETGNPQDPEFLWGLLKIVRSTGRPVEA